MAAGFRLNDESFITFIADELLKLFEVVRQFKRLRKEVILGWKLFLHAHQMSAQHVLASEVINAWYMIAPLPRLHFL